MLGEIQVKTIELDTVGTQRLLTRRCFDSGKVAGMPYEILSRRSIESAIRAGDQRRFNVNLKDNWEFVVDEVLATPLDGKVFSDLNEFSQRGKLHYSCKTYSEVVLQRACAVRIAKLTGVRPRDRDQAVLGALEALQDSGEFTVRRRDIKNFYESVSVDAIRSHFLNRRPLPKDLRHLIDAYFNNACRTATGLPRGLPISAVLGEQILSLIEQKIREIEGVFSIFRFADDFIIFSSKGQDLDIEIESCLPFDLKFNLKNL